MTRNEHATDEAEIEASAVNASYDAQAVRRWYTGKARERLLAALEQLDASEREGAWIPGASRKVVRAALNKANVAHRAARTADEFYRAAVGDAANAWHVIHMALQYLDCYVARAALCTPVRATAPKFTTRPCADDALARADLLALTHQLVIDFTPVYRLVDRLDATRPRPTYAATGAVSPTVAKTLGEAGLDLAPSTVRVPEIEWRRVKLLPRGTGAEWGWIGVIKWPTGTRHWQSRFAVGDPKSRARYEQCHACGHGLPKGLPHPILIDDQKGAPHSLWVGADCLRTVFGIKVQNEASYDRGEPQ